MLPFPLHSMMDRPPLQELTGSPTCMSRLGTADLEALNGICRTVSSASDTEYYVHTYMFFSTLKIVLYGNKQV